MKRGSGSLHLSKFTSVHHWGIQGNTTAIVHPWERVETIKKNEVTNGVIHTKHIGAKNIFNAYLVVQYRIPSDLNDISVHHTQNISSA